MMQAWALLILMGVSLMTNAQQADSTFSKQKVKSTQYEYLFSYYHQDGNNSAITGGTGTELLNVYINKLNVTHAIDSFNTILVEAGMDIISSASTDRIDYSISSASSKDNRFWLAAGYQKSSKDKKRFIGIKPSFALESDYLSWGVAAWWAGRNNLNNWRYGVNVQLFADDLRWGRLNEEFRRPVTLVYPVELRDSLP